MAALTMRNERQMKGIKPGQRIDMFSPVKEYIPAHEEFKSFFLEFAPQFDKHLKTKFKNGVEPNDEDTIDIKREKIDAMIFIILITVFGTQIFPYALYKNILDIPSIIGYAQTITGGVYTVGDDVYSLKSDGQKGGGGIAKISALVLAFGALASSVFKADNSARNVMNVEQQLVGAVNLLEKGNDAFMDHAHFSWDRVKDLYDDSIEFASCMSNNSSTSKWTCYRMAPALLDNLLGGGKFETNAEFDVQVTYPVGNSTVSYVLGPANEFSDYLNAVLYPPKYHSSFFTDVQLQLTAYASGVSVDDIRDISHKLGYFDETLATQFSLIANSFGRNKDALKIFQQGSQLYARIIPAVLEKLQKGAEHQIGKMGQVGKLSVDLADQSAQVKKDFAQLGATLFALYVAFMAFFKEENKGNQDNEGGGNKTRNKRKTNKKKRKTIKRRKTNKSRKVSRK
jgi:hypothetical protein